MSFSSGLQFRVIGGEREKDRVIRLDGKELTLGRAQKGQRPGQGEVLFREPTVSRLHASLSWKERKGGFQLVHKSGTNPTLVNGKPTKKILLAPGDRVQMGLLILELEEAMGGRPAASTSLGGDGRNRPSMTEPILEALNKVERQHEEDRRRARAENEQKQRQREIMAAAAPYVEPSESPASARSRRLDEALRAAPPRPEDERKKRRGGPTFGWQPPEEREEIVPVRVPDTPPTHPERTVREVSYEDERTNHERRAIPLSEPELAPEAPAAARREAVYELVVVKGPDQGRRFPLKDMVMVLGQRQGDHDERDGQGVLLNDATLPAEMGLFAWQGREGSYGLLASEGSMQIIEVDRISDGQRRRIRVDSASSLLLKVADEIQVGLTTLRVQKIGEPVPVFKARIAAPPPPERPLAAAEPPSGPTPLRQREVSGFGRPRNTGWRDAPASPPAAPPAPVKPAPAPEAEPSPSGREGELPLWAQATLVPGRDQSQSPMTGSSSEQPPPRTPKPAVGDEVLEWGNRPVVDFLFEFTAGPLRGCQVSVSRGELSRPKRFNAGSIGSRHNEVSLEGADIPNEAFHLVGEEGRFSLCNESPTGLLLVNRSPLKTGDRVVLMTGDTIVIGTSTIRFLERETVMVLSQYGLLAESGVTSDQDRIFPLNRQRLLVGRGKGCDIRLADLEVSRVHLGLAYSEGRFSVQHRSETNPTFLNGLSLMPGTVRSLKAGDRIRLSSLTVLRFVDRHQL